MIQDEKNIDRLFQEKFKDFDALPDNALWDKIESQLDAKEDTEKIPLIPWWIKRSAVAAILLIGLGFLTFISTNINSTNKPTENPVNGVATTPKNSNNTNNNNGTTTINKSAIINQNATTNTSVASPTDNSGNNNAVGTTNNNGKATNFVSQKNVFSSNNTKTAGAGLNTLKNASKKYAYQQNNYNSKYNNNGILKGNNKHIAYQNTSNTTNNVATNNNNTNSNATPNTNNINVAALLLMPGNEGKGNFTDTTAAEAIVDNTPVLTLDDILKQQNNEEEEETDGFAQKWSINPNVAPVYYSSLSQGSPISSEFANNKKSGNINMSFGINIALNVNKKLSVRSGINKVAMGYSTDGVYFTNSTRSANTISTIDYASSGANIALANNETALAISPGSNYLTQIIESSASIEKYQGSLKQNIDYLEIPLEVKYNVLDSKLGISLIGGVSTLVLSNNEILLESDGLVTNVGKANNLNSVNFSTNVGLGVNYMFTDKLMLNVEPMFKYQLNTYNTNSNGFKPYALGLYTGFSFRF